jgi:hypothetical protein
MHVDKKVGITLQVIGMLLLIATATVLIIGLASNRRKNSENETTLE